VSDSRIRGIYYPPEKKEKKKIAHVLPKQRSRGGEIAIWGAMRSKFYHHYTFLPSLSFTPPHIHILI